ncbi:MAG: hypothetical protein KGJ06_04145, partial [Pseudomonadota bacterium]|nr:hypothetical protein [Pseudomonadota bacterium]
YQQWHIGEHNLPKDINLPIIKELLDHELRRTIFEYNHRNKFAEEIAPADISNDNDMASRQLSRSVIRPSNGRGRH